MKASIKKLGMLVGLMMTFLTATAYDFEVNGLFYSINSDNKSCTIVASPSKNYSGDVIIPDSVDYRGKRLVVTTIGERCFYDCKLESLTIPSTIKEVLGWALANNETRTVYINKLIIQDANSVLWFKRDGGAVYSDDVHINNLYIGRSLQGGEIYLYDGGQISFGDVSMNIDTPIYFNESITGGNWFDTIIIPASVNTISLNNGYGRYDYSNTKIKNLKIPEANNKLSLGGNISFIHNFEIGREISRVISNNIDSLIFKPSLTTVPTLGAISLKSIILPSKLSEIPDNFLGGCTGLKMIFIPNTVSRIGPRAFANCKDLEYVSLSSSIEIPEGCFSGCLNLKFLKGCNQILGIGNEAFSYTGLSQFVLSKSLMHIGDCAFMDSKLTDLYFATSECVFSTTSFSGMDNLKSIHCSSLPDNECSSLGFSNVNFREADLFVPDSLLNYINNLTPWNQFWVIKPFAKFEGASWKYETVRGEKGSAILLTEVLKINDGIASIDSSILKFESSNDEIATVNWPYLYFNHEGECIITLSTDTTRELGLLKIIVKEKLPDAFIVDGITYKVLDISKVEVSEINRDGIVIIPSNVVYEDVPYNVESISAKISYDTKSITIPQNCREIKSLEFDSNSQLTELLFEVSESTLTVGKGARHLSSNVIPYPNPSTVDEERTGFLNGYYDGLFYGLPIERLVINRNIEIPQYYERTVGSSTSSYTTVYHDVVYFPPFYGLTNLKYVEIGENVSAICKNQIEAVVNAVPTTMEYTNFGKCDNIEVVISNNPNAPIGGGFSQVAYDNAYLFLPNGGVDSYKNDDYWKNFAHISETSFIPVKSISFESDELAIGINESNILNPIINPSDASIKTLKWSSSNSSIINVSGDGVVTSSSREGEATITATACDGTNVSASIKIMVQEVTGISDVGADSNFDISIKDGCILISGKAETDIVEIYNIQGQLIASSTSNIININSNGVYLVKIGSICKKIVL